MSPNPATGPAAAAPFDLAPGPWHWRVQSHDRLSVRLLIAPERRIAVDLWWNREGGAPDIQLAFGLYGSKVELGCLRGNGFDAPGLHRAGFGTLAVNVAIQALQAHCAAQLPVEGVLSNTDEIGLPESQRLPLEESRRAFWRRFGLKVVQRGQPALDYLQGQVGDLHVVRGGLVAGQFSRCPDLKEFER
jgi:hypothetical protein